jgi:integrase
MGKSVIWTTQTIQFLTQDEVRRLLGVIASKRDAAIFLLAYRHGLRASEVGLLHVQDLDVTQQRLRLHRLKNPISGVHPLRPDEAKAIKASLRQRPYDSPTLFTSKRRDPISRRQLDNLMKDYGERADLPASKRHFHVLKHSIATHLLLIRTERFKVQATAKQLPWRISRDVGALRFRAGSATL